MEIVHIDKLKGKCPEKRYGHTSTVVGNFLYLFGGCSIDGSLFMKDLNIYNLPEMKWVDCIRAPENIDGRHFHTCCVHKDSRTSESDRLLFFGGKSNGYKNDLFFLELKTNNFGVVNPNFRAEKLSSCVNEDVLPPSPRYGHSACFHQKLVKNRTLNKMYVFGGYDNNGFTKNDLYSFSFIKNEWRRIIISPIPHRYHHSGVLLGDSYFIIGGIQKNYSALSDIFRIDLLSNNNNNLKKNNTNEEEEEVEGEEDDDEVEVFKMKVDNSVASYGHECFVLNGDKIYMYGGRTSTQEFKHMLRLDQKDGNFRWENANNNSTNNNIYSVFSNLTRLEYSYCTISIYNHHYGSQILFFGGQKKPIIRTNIQKKKKKKKSTKFVSFILTEEEEEDDDETGKRHLRQQNFTDFLPFDCVFQIFEYLTEKDITRIGCTSRKWSFSHAGRSDRVWERLYTSAKKNTFLTSKQVMKIVWRMPTPFQKFRMLKKLEFQRLEFERRQNEKIMGMPKIKFSKYLLRDETKEVKTVIVGYGGIGKTSLFYKITNGIFPDGYIPTMFDNYNAILGLGKKMNLRASINLWDTSGEEDYDRLRPLSYPETDVFLLAFDISDPSSLDLVKTRWFPEVRHYAPKTPVILVGCKLDLRDDPTTIGRLKVLGERPVTTSQGVGMAMEIGAVRYIETSALEDINVCKGNIFLKLVCAVAIAHEEFQMDYNVGSGDKCGVM